MWMDGVTSGCVHCSVWAEGLLGATGQPIGSRDPRAVRVRSRWEGDSGAGGIVNVTVTVVTVSAGASDRKVCEANTKASSSAVLVVLSRGIMGMTWTLTLRSVDQMSTRPPPPVHATRSQRGDRDCSSQGATVGLDGLNLGDPGATVGAIIIYVVAVKDY